MYEPTSVPDVATAVTPPFHAAWKAHSAKEDGHDSFPSWRRFIALSSPCAGQLSARPLDRTRQITDDADARFKIIFPQA